MIDESVVTIDPTGVDALLARIADPAALAGGGAASALAGAAAAALVAMVGGIAARHAASGPAEVAADADRLRRRLTELIAVDIDTYGRVLEARRRRDAARAAALREALVGATRVPLEIAEASLRILEHCLTLRPFARPSTVADLDVAGVLAAAGLDGAILTAQANLEGLDAPAFLAETGRRLAALRERGRELRARLGQTFPDTTPGADAAPR